MTTFEKKIKYTWDLYYGFAKDVVVLAFVFLWI